MSYRIRPVTKDDEPFLWEMLYHAAHMAEEGATALHEDGLCCHWENNKPSWDRVFEYAL